MAMRISAGSVPSVGAVLASRWLPINSVLDVSFLWRYGYEYENSVISGAVDAVGTLDVEKYVDELGEVGSLPISEGDLKRWSRH